MIDKQLVQNLILEKLQGTGYELITLKISAQNEILIEVDKLDGVDVEFCAEVNHYLVEQLEAQGIEDYSLEVGSVSLTAPFITKMQYDKHLNHDVEVIPWCAGKCGRREFCYRHRSDGGSRRQKTQTKRDSDPHLRLQRSQVHQIRFEILTTLKSLTTLMSLLEII